MSNKYYDPKKAHERYMRNRDSILAKMKAKRDSRSPEEKERDLIAQREYEAAYRELNRDRYNATKRAYWRKRHPVVLAFLFFALFCQAQTVDQVAKEMHRQQVPHANIVLAQARLETGNFTSNRCKRDHNLFGIKHNGKYARYRTWQDSIKDYKRRISSRYQGGDYYQFLAKIGYAEDAAYRKKVMNIVRTSKTK